MAIDSYSLCPGGRGKKIQFCCPEHIKDLEQIDRMIEGEQFSAGLAFVDNLLKTNPDCACLTEAKCLFQRMIGLWEDAYETATQFKTREPKNIVALTELATTAALLDKPQEAVAALVDALENVEGDQFPVAILQAMLTVGLSLYETGRIFPAIAVAKQLQAFAPKDEASNAFLYRCLGSDSVPLMLKEQVFDLTAPDSFPKKAEYEAAVGFLARGQWKRGRDILETLLPFADEWPNLYRNLGIVEMWFANEEKGRELLEKYLSADGLDFEAVVDAEQFLLLLENPTWDDYARMEKRVYTIEKFDEAFEKMLSAGNFVVSRQLQGLKFGDTPPKNAFVLLNRSLTDKTIDLTLDDVARQLGYVLVYGKQTTREARAEVFAIPWERESVEKALTDALGYLPPLESTESIDEQMASWTSYVSIPRFQFKDPAKLTTETLERLFDDAFAQFAVEWFNHPFRVFGGKSPKEVLATPNGKRKVEAMTRIVLSSFTPNYQAPIEKLLRDQTQIEPPKPIDPPENMTTPEDAAHFFRLVPLWRWGRLNVAKLSSSALAELLQIANLVAPPEVKEKFAKELKDRPVGDVQYDDRAVAFSILIDSALMNQDSDAALALISEIGAYARSIGESDGRWKVLEIMTRFRRQEFDKVRTMAQDVFRDYQDDPETIQTLQNFFEQINAQAQAQLQAAEAYRRRAGIDPTRPAAAAPSSAPNETRLDFTVGGSREATREERPSGLWTPGSDDAGGSSSGGAKLWTPD